MEGGRQGARGGPLAGTLSGVLCFVLAALAISQIASAVFGFWSDAASKASLEGLPPYVTVEMVEAALECQEEYGHPAGCTLAQIICESGQGDGLSALAERDKNLFGIKWSPSFLGCPEVAGKSSWATSEEVGGQVVGIMADFTTFKSRRDCIVFRSRVLLSGLPYVGNALIREAIASCDSDRMAEGLKDAGYATSSSYVEALKAAMDEYGLRRFDGMSMEDFRAGAADGDAIVAAAESQLGVPYVWGGSIPGVGLDCSGLTQWCYAQAGIDIPRYFEDQAASGKRVPLSEAEPGGHPLAPRPRRHLRRRRRVHPRAQAGGRVQAGDRDRLLHLRRPLQIAKRQEDSHAEEEQGDARRGHRHGRDSRRDDGGCCSIAHTAGQANADPLAASLEQPAVLEELRGSAWTAADGSGKTLAFREGSFVESDGALVAMTAFEVEGSGSSGAQRWLDVLLLKDGDAASRSATIVLDEDGGTPSVACDGFSLSGRYVLAATPGGAVEVTGLAEPYPSLVDGRTDELAAAISEWAAGHAPTAASATFDGEVFVDIAGGRVSATFHLDDDALTIVTAVYRSGEFTVLG